jgi:hypothetical protein
MRRLSLFRRTSLAIDMGGSHFLVLGEEQLLEARLRAPFGESTDDQSE